jgi:hypothetical protein
MPPNRKSPTLFTSSLELERLKIPLQAKFLPLTDPREATQQSQQKCVQQKFKADPKTEKPTPTVSYWDWPSDTAEEEKLEAFDDFFSLSRLESNLIADSIRREETATVHVFVTKTVEKQIENQQSYWDWSNEDVDSVEPEIDSQDDKTVQREDHRREECCDGYWEWRQDEATEDECTTSSPSRRLHELMTDSRKKFVRRHCHLPELESQEDTSALSDHYWHWSEFRGTSAQ